MARFTKNHMLEISAAIAVVGIALVAVSFLTHYTETSALDPYRNLVAGGWNLWIMVISPFILITGAWYMGEQIHMRRKFSRLLDTEKRSEFSKHVRDLEDLARRLPDGYSDRIEEKAATFKSRR